MNSDGKSIILIPVRNNTKILKMIRVMNFSE